MIEKIFKSIKNPKKAWRFFTQTLKYSLRKKRGTLLIIGLDDNGVLGLLFRGYKKIYGFEANPDRFKKLQNKFANHPHVKLLNVAAAPKNGVVEFHISSNNNGASSSMGTFKDEWDEYKTGKLKMNRTIKVPCINIFDFCQTNDIQFIDDYISDIQGMDLEVLKTMFPMILERKIGTITCEVTKNDKGNIYKGLPDNSEKGFNEILNEHYKLIAKGWGMLKDNQFDPIPDESWEMDCKWERKKI